MAATIQSILAKVLIQVGADEPKEIGTIEIPIHLSIPENAYGKIDLHPGAGHFARGGAEVPGR